MNRIAAIRTCAVVILLALCLSLPHLVPASAQVSAPDEPCGFVENTAAMGSPEEDNTEKEAALFCPEDTDMIEGLDHSGEGDTEPPPDDTAGGTADASNVEDGPFASDGLEDSQDREESGGKETDLPPNNSVDDTHIEAPGTKDTPANLEDETAEENMEGMDADDMETGLLEVQTEESLSGLVKSSRSVPGYNVFEVSSYAELAEALRNTSYPSTEHPETNVYILLTEDVPIEQGFALHSSIEKVTIDGDNLYTLSEISPARTQVSRNTAEVTFKDLTILGNQYYGLFDNPYGTDVSYHYERVNYTGPQLLYATNSAAHFTDSNIRISGVGGAVNEVAEVRDVYIYGRNSIQHNSSFSVFALNNGGNLVLREDAALGINALGENPYILFTANAKSTLRLEDRASLHIEGRTSQLAGGTGLHSIYLGRSAVFHWEAHRAGGDYIAVNASGGAKDAIYLSEGAELCVAPTGTVNDRLIRINGGNVVVGEGAKLIIQADSYTTPGANAPFSLAPGSSLAIGNAATLLMEIGNSVKITYGLVTFGGGAASSFVIDRDATVVLRGNQTSGAVFFGSNYSSMEINAPNYLEIATTGGGPIYFYNASATYPGTLTYTDVQQINYWHAGSDTYLNGATPAQRWLAEAGGISINATFSGNGNGQLSAELTGGTLNSEWTPTIDAYNFSMTGTQILSVGKISMEVSPNGAAYQGRMTAPNMGVPYTQGSVQLREGRPGADRAVSVLASATPEFYVAPNQTIGTDDISLWAEFGYVFHNNPLGTTGGALSFSVPGQIQFGTVPISFADTELHALSSYALHVQDSSGAGWQVMASFSGFSNADQSLDCTLAVNDVLLQETPQPMASSAGSKTVPLNASLLVPGGAADAGTFMGNITWTLVDAP